MEDFSEIENALGGYVKSEYEDDGVDVRTSQITINSVDPTETLNNRVTMLMNENAELRRELDEIKRMVRPMYTWFCKSSDRSRVNPPDRNKLRNMEMGRRVTLDGDTTEHEKAESFVEVRSDMSDVSSTAGFPIARTGPSAESTTGLNPFAMITPSPSGTRMLKSNAATAPQGYSNKTTVWGTALASMLISAMRYYIDKKDASMIMIEEMYLMKIYSHIVGPLYEMSQHKGLPGVTDPMTTYLSKAIARISPTDVPTSTANAWLVISNDPDGKQAMSVLRIIVSTAKQVPEAMMHPISQMIPYLFMDIVVRRGEDAVFSMHKDVNVPPNPNPWESWCRVLKPKALEKYIRYRTSGMEPEETISTMVNSMRSDELTDKKNWNKIMGYGMFTKNFGG